jgi:hypothetical protein
VSLLLVILGACFAGLVATICMTVFEFPFWRRWGMEGVAEWQVNTVMVSVLIRRLMLRRVVAWMSVAMHLFHGAALGIVFRLLLLLDLLVPAVLWSSVLRLCHCVQRCALDYLSVSY